MPSADVLLTLLHVTLWRFFGFVAQMLLVSEGGKKLWIVKLRVALSLAGQEYTFVQVWKSSHFATGMKH
jgi:type IV secretory pathway TrbD component